MPPQKGKQLTKGAKQIVQENQETLKFYTLGAGAVTSVNIVIFVLLFWGSITWSYLFLTALSICVHVCSIYFLRMMSAESRAPDGTLLDSGSDINMESGMSENVKDLIILTIIVQLLSMISMYFWILFLAAPGRAGYLLWIHLIQPWATSGSEEEDVSEKKKKKMERKMKRQTFVKSR